MKNLMKSAMTGLGVAVLLALGVTNTFAWTTGEMKVNLSHAVTLGQGTLAAGEYFVRLLPASGNSSVIEFTPETSGSAAIALVTEVSTRDNAPADKAQVLLRHNGAGYEIDKIFFEGSNVGYEVLSPRGK
ncbi:MAG: hypothetical protein JSU00_10680 [Acidobacteria bacterium]|nr:hypothetical protein [Acidobacteriota bacterium]